MVQRNYWPYVQISFSVHQFTRTFWTEKAIILKGSAEDLEFSFKRRLLWCTKFLITKCLSSLLQYICVLCVAVNTANINRLNTFILPFPYSVTKHTLIFKINTPSMKFKMCMEIECEKQLIICCNSKAKKIIVCFLIFICI